MGIEAEQSAINSKEQATIERKADPVDSQVDLLLRGNRELAERSRAYDLNAKLDLIHELSLLFRLVPTMCTAVVQSMILHVALLLRVLKRVLGLPEATRKTTDLNASFLSQALQKGTLKLGLFTATKPLP